MDIKGFMAKNRIDILLVLALFLLAFGIRSIPSDKFPDIYGFDSFWAARMTKNMINGASVFPLNDTVADYPYGRITYPTQIGWWGINAIAYKTIAAINGISGFDYGLFSKIFSWNNAIFGALAIPAIFIFGRLGFNRWVGLAAALILATSGNHLFYSIYGHAENDATGFALFFFALASFIFTVKSRKLWAGALSTLLFGWLLLTFQIYDIAALLAAGTVAVYFAAYFVLRHMGLYKDSPERQEHRKWLLIALAFVTASAIFEPLLGMQLNAGVYSLTGGLGAIFLGSAIEYFLTRKDFYRNALAASVISAVAITAFLGPGMFLTPLKLIGVVQEDAPAGEAATDYATRLWTTVAEQSKINGDFIQRLEYLSTAGFGITIWLALGSVLYLGAKVAIMPFVKKDFNYEWEVLALAFVFVYLWKLSDRSISLFILSGGVAFGAGLMLGEIVRIIDHFAKSRDKGRIFAKAGALFAIVAIGLSFNTQIIQQAQGFGYDVPREWFNTFKFLNTVPKGSVVTAWWDYGHWMNYFNGENIRTTIDNIQDKPKSIYDVARAFTKTPPCKLEKSTTAGTDTISCDITKLEQAEIDSLNLLRPYGTTHVLIDKEIVLGKFGALENIAANGVGCMLGVGAKEQDGRIVTGLSTGSGQVSFSKEEWAQMSNMTWPGTPLANIKVFARTDSGGPMLYVPAFYRKNEQGYTSCDELRGDSPVLYSFADRLFFKDPSLKHVKLVYDDGWNVIYTVDWASVPKK